jgi:hypothetical protein
VPAFAALSQFTCQPGKLKFWCVFRASARALPPQLRGLLIRLLNIDKRVPPSIPRFVWDGWDRTTVFLVLDQYIPAGFCAIVAAKQNKSGNHGGLKLAEIR